MRSRVQALAQNNSNKKQPPKHLCLHLGHHKGGGRQSETHREKMAGGKTLEWRWRVEGGAEVRGGFGGILALPEKKAK